MTDGLKDAHREAIIAVIAANDRVERAVLFGSRATGTNTVSSDVDIALLGKRLTLTDQARLVAALDEIPMAQSVDLLLYDSLQDRTLREHIRRQGIEWYSRSRDAWSAASGRHSLEEWPTVRLGDAAELLTGFPFKSDGYVSDSAAPRLLRGDNIVQGRLRWDGAKRWPAETAAPMAKFRLHEGDVVLAMDRPWIEAGLKFASVQREDLPALLVQRVARLRGGEGLDTRFLKYVIGCRDFSDYVLSVQTGTAIPHISARQIEDYEFDLPPLDEQTAIASILGNLDDKIELNRRMNATLEAMARALFRSWFVDFDPVLAKMEGRDTGLPKEIADLFPDRLMDSELGEVPEGWSTWRLQELADHHAQSITPSSDPEAEFDLFSIPAYDAGQLPAKVLGEAIRSNKAIVPANAVLLSKLNPSIARVWMPERSSGRLQVCSTEFLVFTPRRPGTRGLLFSVFTDVNFRDMLQSMATGTSGSHQRVPAKGLKLRRVLAGSPAVVGAFGDLVAPVLARTIDVRAESRTLVALRDALLPKLVSGELRVTGLEAPNGRDDQPAPVGAHGA